MIDITNYLNQTVSIKSRIGFDENGKPSTSSGVNHPARFVDVQDTIRLTDSQQLKIDGRMWVEPNVNLNIDDIVTSGGRDYRVIQTYLTRDLEGVANHIRAEVKLVV